ncbi:MAG: PcfJ domain-containing protein [Pseudomonadota bacterium]
MPRDSAPRDGTEERRPRYVGPADPFPTKAQEALLRRYHPALRRRARMFAATGPRCADLLASFPAAAAMIATAERGPATGEAVSLVKAGAPLKILALVLGLPLWLRKLPPEAFGPGPVEPLWSSADFARRIPNAIPAEPSATAMWVRWTAEALRIGPESFALWVAALPIYPTAPMRLSRPKADLIAPSADLLAPLAAFAHASLATPEDPAFLRRWRVRQPFDQAVMSAAGWLDRVVNGRCVTQGEATNWNSSANVAGFRITPLSSGEQLLAESEAMDNCLDTYVGPVSRGECRIFAVRRSGRSVANVELRPNSDPGGFYLAQLRGRGNEETHRRVDRAVRRWMATLGPCPMSKNALVRQGQIDPALWRAEWSAYVDAYPAASALWREGAPHSSAHELARRLRTLAMMSKKGAR